MGRVPIISFRIDDFVEFLSTKREDLLSSKDIELQSAVVLAKMVSQKKGEEYRIGLPAIAKKRLEYGRLFKPTIEQVIEGFADEDCPQDIFLISESEMAKRTTTRPKGHGFQLKRVFLEDAEESIEDHIVAFLNGTVRTKYAKASNTSLVLILSCSKSGVIEYSLNAADVRERLNSVLFPFDRILMLFPDNTERYVFCEIWPDFGSDFFTLERI